MKEITIATLGSLPTFNMTTADPLYWISRLCYEKSLDRYNANVAGFTRKLTESSDLTTMTTALSGDFADFQDWWEDFLVDKGTAFAGNLLDLAPLITAIATGGSDEVLSIMIGFLINTIMLNSSADGKAENDNTKEIGGGLPSSIPDTLHIEINNDLQGNYDDIWSVTVPPES